MTTLVTGAGGSLGSVILRELFEAREPALGLTSVAGPRPRFGDTVSVDLAEPGAAAARILELRPSLVIHAAAVSSVQVAYERPDFARRINEEASREIGRAAGQIGARVVYVSTDMVFGGERAPYDEASAPGPLSSYGRSKLAGERAVLSEGPNLVVRLPLMYGVTAVDRPTTFRAQVESLRQGRPLGLFHDEWRTPLSYADAARAVLRAARSALTGVLHAGGPARLSRLDMGRLLAQALGVARPAIESVASASLAASEPRARDLSLDSSRFERELGVPAGRPMAECLAAMPFD